MSALTCVIAVCQRTAEPDRALDAQIALAVFPSLAELPAVDPGIWVQADGTRVRALRYSACRTTAATLVPPGFWIEDRGHESIVCGADGEWSGMHKNAAIALCIAALSARESSGPTRPSPFTALKETNHG